MEPSLHHLPRASAAQPPPTPPAGQPATLGPLTRQPWAASHLMGGVRQNRPHPLKDQIQIPATSTDRNCHAPSQSPRRCSTTTASQALSGTTIIASSGPASTCLLARLAAPHYPHLEERRSPPPPAAARGFAPGSTGRWARGGRRRGRLGDLAPPPMFPAGGRGATRGLGRDSTTTSFQK